MRAVASSASDGLFGFLDAAHVVIVAQLQALTALATAAEAGALNTAQRAQARSLVAWFSTEARQHHLDEERHVFPTLLCSQDEAIIETTYRLIQDHGWLEADWVEIEPALLAAAEGRYWFDPVVLRRSVAVFQEQCLKHIQLEESIAYPQAHARMDSRLLIASGGEMAHRQALRQARTECEAVAA